LEPHRSAIQKAINGYVSQRYATESAAGGAFSKDGNIVVVIVGEKPNLRNFWSGKWTSTWTVTVNGSSASVVGDIKVSTHVIIVHIVLL
jgi:capping protein alpha